MSEWPRQDFGHEDYLFDEISRPISHVVFHTVAADRQISIEELDRWHRERGWAGCGYNELIDFDGQAIAGRNPNIIPAGARGLNRFGYHIAVMGHGDRKPFRCVQKLALADRIIDVSRRCRTPVSNERLIELLPKNPMRVIGHREVNRLIKFYSWLTNEHRTTKSCPGNLVNCSGIRRLVLARMT